MQENVRHGIERLGANDNCMAFFTLALGANLLQISRDLVLLALSQLMCQKIEEKRMVVVFGIEVTVGLQKPAVIRTEVLNTGSSCLLGSYVNK